MCFIKRKQNFNYWFVENMEWLEYEFFRIFLDENVEIEID